MSNIKYWLYENGSWIMRIFRKNKNKTKKSGSVILNSVIPVLVHRHLSKNILTVSLLDFS